MGSGTRGDEGVRAEFPAAGGPASPFRASGEALQPCGRPASARPGKQTLGYQAERSSLSRWKGAPGSLGIASNVKWLYTYTASRKPC